MTYILSKKSDFMVGCNVTHSTHYDGCIAQYWQRFVLKRCEKYEYAPLGSLSNRYDMKKHMPSLGRPQEGLKICLHPFFILRSTNLNMPKLEKKGQGSFSKYPQLQEQIILFILKKRYSGTSDNQADKAVTMSQLTISAFTHKLRFKL